MTDAPAVDRLLDDLSLASKVAQLGSVRIGTLLTDGAFDPDRAADVIPDGIGRVTRVGRESDLDPPALARVVRDLQAYLRTETPHGIPALVREESLCGYAGRGGTAFPGSIGLASTWDPELVEGVTASIAGELRAVGCTVTLSPVADLGREPRWGRIEETYGEDTHLAARMTAAAVDGLQSDPDAVHATLKHFVGHGRPEGGRNRAPATASLHEMRDADLVPFRAGVQRADAASVMAAYHAVDGVPCHASRRLLTDLLRDEWDFEGTVVSDGRGIEQLVTDHRVATDRQAAGVLALGAGVDVELPETECFGERLVDAVETGAVDASLVDRAVRRHLRQKARLGLLDDPAAADPDPDVTAAVFDADRTRDLAREAARRSLVLLANDGTLPLSQSVESVAVVGPNADAGRNLLGSYAYGAAESMAGAGPVVTPLAALRDRLGNDRVAHARGCAIRADLDDGDRADADDDLAAAVETARSAAVAVAVVGGQSGIDVERETTGTAGEGRDRTDLSLPGHQGELVRRVADTGTPLVVVLVSGRPLAVPDVVERADAVLAAWVPGQEGGHAIADVLLGTDPGGRLPVSIPRSVGQVPVHYSRTPVSSAGEYVFDSGTPLFPFGHGESYASFSYDSITAEPTDVPTDGDLSLTVDLHNESDVAGTEVVQVYASDRVASVVRPERELVAFRRLALDPGEAATVAFELPAGLFAFHDSDGSHVVEPGTVEVGVGRSAADRRLAATVELVGEPIALETPAFFGDVTVT
jgi:beta-glucosidase